MNVTFEQLPEAVSRLFDKLSEIQNLLESKTSNESADRWLSLDELCAYDPSKRAKPTVYGLVHKKLIPYHKRGKKLYFLKSEIDQWLKEGRKETIQEIQDNAGDSFKLRRTKR